MAWRKSGTPQGRQISIGQEEGSPSGHVARVEAFGASVNPRRTWTPFGKPSGAVRKCEHGETGGDLRPITAPMTCILCCTSVDSHEHQQRVGRKLERVRCLFSNLDAAASKTRSSSLSDTASLSWPTVLRCRIFASSRACDGCWDSVGTGVVRALRGPCLRAQTGARIASLVERPIARGSICQQAFNWSDNTVTSV
jgi:hypothetical protein